MKEKENPFAIVFEELDKAEASAIIKHKQLVEEDKNKSLLDILPADFKNVKRSIVKRTILRLLKESTELLNSCATYNSNKIYSEKEVARYMMIGVKYSNFFLSELFVPKIDLSDLWVDYYIEHKKSDNTTNEKERKEERDILRVVHEKENKAAIEECRNVNHHLACLIQSWEQYEDRQKVKRGELIDSYDMEDDGFPRTGRGNLCYLFIPVKGKFPTNKTGEFKLRNPRTKKDVTFQIEKYKAEVHIYSCINDKGKKVFLVEHETVVEAYSCLFSSNKEIFAGWWNKVMISKEK